MVGDRHAGAGFRKRIATGEADYLPAAGDERGPPLQAKPIEIREQASRPWRCRQCHC